MSKGGKSITEGATDAEVVSIKTGKSIATLPLDKPNTQPDLEAKEQAELQAKIKAEEAVQDAKRVEALQQSLDSLLKVHQEKASLAFELLKSVVHQKSETIIQGTIFNKLVKNIFTLADTFKQEVDERWTADVQATTNRIKGVKPVTDETVSTTVN